jgi:heme exporter protein C
MKKIGWANGFGLFGLVLLLIGSYIGLFVAPPERFMGEVQRIMYIHVPCAWVGMVCYTWAFISSIASLWFPGKPKWDARVVAAIEVGMVLNALLLVQGMIWGHKTWGVFWDWDVRLTTSLVMLLLFGGVLALRAFVEDPGRKHTWTAVATIVAFVDVPLVYFSVRWWRSLHQAQSSPDTVSSIMVVPLRINSFAILFLAIWMMAMRFRIEMRRQQRLDIAEPVRLELSQETD